jgi:hypothetical protein
MRKSLAKRAGRPPPPPRNEEDTKGKERCPRCGAENPWQQVGQYALNNHQYGYVIICTQCNYQKSRISASKQDVDRDNKEYSYDFAPKEGQYIAPVKPLNSKGSSLW